MPKETGMMFKGPLVRAILEGRKTQTRRILKMRPGFDLEERDDGRLWPWAEHPDRCDDVWQDPPAGNVGDHIYVRETWAEIPRPLPLTDESLPWRMDDRIIVYKADPEWDGARSFLCADGCMRWAKPDRWSPSIHMPKDLARIWLEITGVRVERLQSITRADIKAEGVEITEPRAFSLYGLNAEQRENMHRTFAAYQFQELWDSTTVRPKLPKNKNSKRYARVKHWLDTHPDTTGWAANPWVWVYDFKRIDPPQS